MVISAGLIMFDFVGGQWKILLVHPGGPLWTGKDQWGIPKGEVHSDESTVKGAKREFEEETGIKPHAPYYFLYDVKYGQKMVYAWAFQGQFSGEIVSNTFQMEWPPKSGKYIQVPENDDGRMFTIDQARKKIMKGQALLIERMDRLLIEKFNKGA